MDYNKHFIDILLEYKIIHVPYYQREYVWGKAGNVRNLDKFIDDIFSKYAEDKNSTYFIGTLAFCSEQKSNWYDVIDGQQRITSLILILYELFSLRCSEHVLNFKKIAYPSETNPDEFVLQEEHSLTEELETSLGYKETKHNQNGTANISSTLKRISGIIIGQWGNYEADWYDGLYNYILNNVVFICLEYNTIGDSLKYFLNINSLSIPLTQSDIFYSILSESLRISGYFETSIYEIKDRVYEIANRYPGLSNSIETYNKQNYFSDDKGINNVIYIFLNAYYWNDNHKQGELDDAGVGKWMSIYKNEVFKEINKAKEFVCKFLSYLDDLDIICSYFENINAYIVDKAASIYTASILLRYNKYSIFLRFLICLFEKRHNYQNNSQNLYVENSENQLDYQKLSEIAKRLNLVMARNYIDHNNDLLTGFEKNIEIDVNGNYLTSIDDIVDNITYENISSLEYNDGGVDQKNKKHRNDSESIKFVFSCQEAYLNSVASRRDVRKDINEYLDNLLDGEKFTIEHIYSRMDYNETYRRQRWQENFPDSFTDPEKFDAIRFKFENLSLLDKRNNSSAKDKEISDKIKTYKKASSVCENEPEYLVQSLVEDSDFYRNPSIQALSLPNRAMIIKDDICWEHSENNEIFNTKLLRLALEEIANKQ